MTLPPILETLPNIRWESNQASTGYTWGKPAKISNILQIIDANPSLATSSKQRQEIPSDAIVAERWLVSDDAESGSLVKINTTTILLKEFLEQNPDLLGSNHLKKYGPALGCVMKQLDTHPSPDRGSLSIQIHPLPNHPTRPAKPEMWLGTGQVYLGWNQQLTAQDITTNFNHGTLEELLNKIEITPQKPIVVPGGTIHAIRFDSFLYEWSMAPTPGQPAKGTLKDATIAIYDRTDGKTPRPGKEDLAGSLQLLAESNGFKPSSETDFVTQPQLLTQTDQTSHTRIFKTNHVWVEKISLAAASKFELDTNHQAKMIYIQAGEVTLRAQEFAVTAQAGQEFLICNQPAPTQLESSQTEAEILVWYPPT